MVAQASSGSAVVTLPTDTRILITRAFAAPRHLVYRAYTEPALIRRWWAGRKGEVTSAEVDLRVGGRWRYALMTPDGFEVAFHGEYREIVENERIVCTEVYEAMPEGAVLNTVTFAEQDGRTTLSLLCEAPDRATRDIIIASGMESGMQEGWDLMEQVAISLGDSTGTSAR
jgi:uncharacterized protein YndB with AHSA1/START domain